MLSLRCCVSRVCYCVLCLEVFHAMSVNEHAGWNSAQDEKGKTFYYDDITSWQANVCQDGVHAFYYNSTSGESTWDLPECIKNDLKEFAMLSSQINAELFSAYL